MKSYFLVVFTLVGILIGSLSCKKLSKYDPDKISETSWNPVIAVPLAHADFGVYDILARTDSNELVIIDNTTGEIALVYKGEIVSFEAEEIINIPGVQDQVDFSLADLGLVPVPSFTNTANFSHSEPFVLTPGNGVEIHTVTFKGGQLNLEFSTDLKHNLTINLTFPEIIKNGSPINETINLNYSGTVPQTIVHSVDLDGAVGDFTVNNTTFNEIIGEYTVTITGTGEEIIGTESIETEISFTDLKYRNATGYFGQQSVGGHADSILIRIFTVSTDGYFELTSPKIRLEMINSFGFPVDVALSNLKTVNENTGQEFILAGYPTPVSIAAPVNFGESETTMLELNSDNTTNLASVITPVPKYFHFEANGISNPDGPTSTLNFIEDTSKFRINAELELPLEGFAYGFTLEDTVEFSFTEDIEEISSVLFRIIVDNGFPVDLFTEIVFVDDNYNELFQLTDGTETIVASGLTDQDGKVTSSTEKITDLIISQDNMPFLGQAKHIILRAEAQSLNGPDGEVVKFYDDYRISVKLGMQVQGGLSF